MKRSEFLKLFGLSGAAILAGKGIISEQEIPAEVVSEAEGNVVPVTEALPELIPLSASNFHSFSATASATFFPPGMKWKVESERDLFYGPRLRKVGE